MVNVHATEDSIVISVKDNGIGIQKEKQDLIFQRFRQVDKSLTRSHEGVD
jgi:signal transduction histidine kinase